MRATRLAEKPATVMTEKSRKAHPRQTWRKSTGAPASGPSGVVMETRQRRRGVRDIRPTVATATEPEVRWGEVYGTIA